MDIIISFFRDILNGPIYIVVSIICSILICSCIGYLAENHINKKKQLAKYVTVSSPILQQTVTTPVSVPQVNTITQSQSIQPAVVNSTTAVNQPVQSAVVISPVVVQVQQALSQQNNGGGQQ